MPVWQAANVAGLGDTHPQLGDLVVLGGEAGQGEGLEVTELDDGLVALGEAVCDVGEVVFEPGDVGVARIGVLAGLGGLLETFFELDAQMGVG